MDATETCDSAGPDEFTELALLSATCD